MIEARSLTVELGGCRVAFDVSLSVPSGGWLMLIGPNGAGKSTVLRALAGLVAHEGQVMLDGRDRSCLNRREIARQVAFVPQTPWLPAVVKQRMHYEPRRAVGGIVFGQGRTERCGLTRPAEPLEGCYSPSGSPGLTGWGAPAWVWVAMFRVQLSTRWPSGSSM